MVKNINLPNLDMEILKDVERTAEITTSPLRLKEDVDEYLKAAAKEFAKYGREETKGKDKKVEKENKKPNKAKKAPKKKKVEQQTAKTSVAKKDKPVVKPGITKVNPKLEKIMSIYEHCMQDPNIDMYLKSPIKWAGGKNIFFKNYEELFRNYYEKGNKYVEPFLGGGSCLFGLAPEKAVVGDVNYELINFYSVLKFNIKELLTELSYYENTEKFYYRVRSWDRDEAYQRISPVRKAARFYYINRMGFNGLYRVNAMGENNVPYGKKTGPFEPDVRTLVAAHLYLNKNSIEIKTAGFRDTLKSAKQGDLVYLDPPMYDNSFRDNAERFTSRDFEVLKLECDILTMNKIDFIMTSTESRFIRELFHDYKITTYESRRSISSKGSKRKGYDDLIITNF